MYIYLTSTFSQCLEAVPYVSQKLSSDWKLKLNKFDLKISYFLTEKVTKDQNLVLLHIKMVNFTISLNAVVKHQSSF